VLGAIGVAVFFGSLGATLTVVAVGLLITLLFSFFFTSVAANAIATTARNPVSGMTMLTIIISSVVLLRFGLSGTTGMFFVMAIAGMVCTALSVSVRPDDLFGRSGDDLTLTVPITVAEAVLGTDLRVPTLDAPVTLRVPAGTPSGRKLRARGKGVIRKDGPPGDLIVTVEMQVPDGVTGEARDALERFAKLTPPARRERIEARLRRAQ